MVKRNIFVFPDCDFKGKPMEIRMLLKQDKNNITTITK